MFALIDGNSFFASCEKIFRPDWAHRPVVVLSNNDGCIVARCALAKALKIPDLVPYFQVKNLLAQHNVVVCSSNYELYGDMSRRLMATAREFAGDSEVYSIDEIFLSLPGHTKDLHALAREIHTTVRRSARIANCVGMAGSLTLAKLANKIAKKRADLGGVFVMDSTAKREWALKRIVTRDVWGVGARLSEQLAALGIHTGDQLARADPKQMRKHFSVNLERTIRELNGEPCLTLDQVPAPKKQIVCSRSFSTKITDVLQLQQAVSKYAERACEKLREQDGQTQLLLVSVESSRFSKISDPYFNQQLVKLDMYTNDSRVITKAASTAAASLFRPGVEFHRAGVMLLELKPLQPEQLHFFTPQQSESSRQLMRSMDAVNRKFGRGTVQLAAQGIEPGWTMARNMKSPAYTTQWAELPTFKC